MSIERKPSPWGRVLTDSPECALSLSGKKAILRENIYLATLDGESKIAVSPGGSDE